MSLRQVFKLAIIINDDDKIKPYLQFFKESLNFVIDNIKHIFSSEISSERISPIIQLALIDHMGMKIDFVEDVSQFTGLMNRQMYHSSFPIDWDSNNNSVIGRYLVFFGCKYVDSLNFPNLDIKIIGCNLDTSYNFEIDKEIDVINFVPSNDDFANPFDIFIQIITADMINKSKKSNWSTLPQASNI